MKCIIMIVVATCALVRAADENTTDIVVNYTWDFLGTSFNSRIIERELYRTPKWNDSEDHPPLSIKRAMAKADQKLKEVVGKPESFSFSRVSLFEPRRNHWVYEVNYLIAKPGEWTNSPKQISIFVLMDGSAVLSKLPDRKPSQK